MSQGIILCVLFTFGLFIPCQQCPSSPPKPPPPRPPPPPPPPPPPTTTLPHDSLGRTTTTTSSTTTTTPPLIPGMASYGAMSAPNIGASGPQGINFGLMMFATPPPPPGYAYAYAMFDEPRLQSDPSLSLIGCYTAFDDDFGNDPAFANDNPNALKLIAPPGKIIDFMTCWQFCLFKSPRSDLWFKVEYIGIRADQTKCFCIMNLFDFHRPLPTAACLTKCTGQSEQFCANNTMFTYLMCMPGFFRAPACQHKCQQGVCNVTKVFPNAQFSIFKADFCKSYDGGCFKKCLNGLSVCPQYTAVCKQIHGDPYGLDSSGIVSTMPTTGISAPNNWPMNYLVMSSFMGLTQITFDIPMVVHKMTWIRNIHIWTMEEGYSNIYTAYRQANTNNDYFNVQVASKFELKQNYKYSQIWKYTLDVGLVNEDGYQINSMFLNGNNTLFAFGLDKNATAYQQGNFIAVRSGKDANQHCATPKMQLALRPGDTLNVERWEPGTKWWAGTDYTYLSALILNEVFVCNDGCVLNQCDCQGKCLFGCNPGYVGAACQAYCFTGWWGLYCSKQCVQNCRDGVCDPVSGYCINGCNQPGVMGAYCTQTCDAGIWGIGCVTPCSKNCFDPMSCSYLDGSCNGGCKDGYLPPNCDKPCIPRTFGTNCQMACGACNNNSICDPITGLCALGCVAGKAPPTCLCPSGFYGANCDQPCGSCAAGMICEAVYGSCIPDQAIVINQAKQALAAALAALAPNVSAALGAAIGTPATPGNVSLATAPASGSNAAATTTAAVATAGAAAATTTAAAAATTSAAAAATTTAAVSAAATTTAAVPAASPTTATSSSNVSSAAVASPTAVLGALPMLGLPAALTAAIGNLSNAVVAASAPVAFNLNSLLPNQSMCSDASRQSPQCICQKGYWYKLCNQKCGQCIGVNCNQLDGLCIGGCQTGYAIPLCVNKCPLGTYGDNCINTCGFCSGGASCDNVDGQCTMGCAAGYKPPYCTTCLDLWYGSNCSSKCGDCAGGVSCNTTNGYCPSGCAIGKEAPTCVCPRGFWGASSTSTFTCTNKCGFCLNNTGCDAYLGICVYGCIAGYTTLYCNKTCDPGFQGPNCAIACGNCFNKTVCNYMDGSCPADCAGSLRPPKCVCMLNTYSDQCLPCGNCVNNTVCNPDSGTCDLGCQPGYRPPNCVCKNGFFGADCSKKCGNCLNNAQCDIVTGECTTGCSMGYKGKLCVDLCDWGFYGTNCMEVCGNCQNCQTCDPSTGNCPQGCQPGYFPPLCQKQCPDQAFGALCANFCGRCQKNDVCRKSDGKCPNGCMPAWQPPLCAQPCLDGFFGANCLATCGNCKSGDACNKIDGTCPNGCQPGYQPFLCADPVSTAKPKAGAQKLCAKGYYGSNCQQPCGHCLNSNCDVESGLCLEGCQAGYMPLQCTNQCRRGFFGLGCAYKCGHCFAKLEVCRFTDGLCRTGCAPGWYGHNCIFETQEAYEASLVSASAERTVINLSVLAFNIALLLLQFF